MQSVDSVSTPTEVVTTSQAPEKTDAATKDVEQVNNVSTELATRTPAKPKYRSKFFLKKMIITNFIRIKFAFMQQCFIFFLINATKCIFR